MVLGGKHRWNEMLFHDVPWPFVLLPGFVSMNLPGEVGVGMTVGESLAASIDAAVEVWRLSVCVRLQSYKILCFTDGQRAFVFIAVVCYGGSVSSSCDSLSPGSGNVVCKMRTAVAARNSSQRLSLCLACAWLQWQCSR